jgi:catechol 2,3-dioxygenase-like lactoylglutathione lyase family enzyme
MGDPEFLAIAPGFSVPDVLRTAHYYRDVLGFHITNQLDLDPDEGGGTVFAIVRRGGIEVFLSRADRPGAPTNRAEVAYDAYLRVTRVDALAIELRASGAKIIEGPANRIYEQRELLIEDCNGLVLAFAEDISGAFE